LCFTNRGAALKSTNETSQHNSSRTGKLDPDILTDEKHDDETIDGPSALE
jgi:hypothetical protein